MDRYKVDQLKRGEELARKYNPELFENREKNPGYASEKPAGGYTAKGTTVHPLALNIPEYKRSSSRYKNDQLENGQRMFEKYMVPRLEWESRERESRLLPGRNLIDEYIEWEKQKARRERMFPQAPTAERTERLNMIGQYQKAHPAGKQTLSAGNGIMVEKDGRNLYISPQEDPEYDKYRKKGEENILFGLSDSGWRATAQSMARFAFDKAGLQALEDMTDEETERYNYILGKYGSAAASSYVDSFREDLNKRWMDREKEETREFAKEHPVLGTAVNMAAPVVSYEPYIAAMAAGLTGQDLDVNSPVFAPVAGEQATREGLKDAVGRGPVKDFLMDTGLSMGQSLARLPLGAGAAGLSAGLSSASAGYLDARERGGTTGQALLSGAAQGAAEGAGEAFSLGRLERFMQAPGKGVKNFAKNVAKQAAVEGSEEGVTELLNTLSDRLIMGDKSNYSAAYQYYKAEGESDVKARLSAAADMAQNILLSAAGGAISGGVMGAGTQAVGFGMEQAYNRQRQAEALAEATKNAAETGGTLKPGENWNRSAGRREEEITKSAEKEGGVSESRSGRTGLEQAVDRLAAQAREEAEEDFSDLGRYGKRVAQKFYDPALDPVEYQKAFNRYYDTAKYHLDPQYPAQAAYTAVLTEKQARAALAAGTLDRERELSRAPQYIQGQAKTGGVVNRSSSATKGQIGVSEALGKKTGLTFVLEEDLGDSEGAYDSGQIRISTDSKNFLQTTSHELTHFMKDYAPQEYSVYRDLAVQALAESQSEDLEATVERYARVYEGQNLSREQLIEEIAADATGEFLNDEAFIEKVVNKDRTIAQKVIDFLSDMIDAIKSVMRRENTRRAAKALKEQADFYEDAREFWMKGLEKAGETYKSGLETEKTELRYQLKDVDEDIDYKSLLKENRELADINRELARQLTLTKDYMPRKEDIKKVAQKMIEEYQSEYPLETLEENLSRLYGYIHNSYQADWEEVTDAAVSIARSVLNKSKVKNTELADHYRDVLKTVRTTKISLPRENRAELEIEGGYNAFRKKYFGKIRLTDQGTAVDTVYQELSGKYPELFPDEIANPSDQLLRIAEVVDSLRPQIDNPYKANIDELSAILGQEIFKQHRSVRALPPTKMDRMKSEMDRLRWEYDRKMDAFKARIKKRYDEQSGDLISRHKEELKARDERLERAKVKRQIIKDVTELKRWLLEPNDKKHVPEELRVPLAGFLSQIDFSSNRLNAEGEETKRTQAWQEAQKAFKEIMDRGNLDQDGNYLELDPDLAARMEELNHVVAEIDKLENLGRYEMEQISNAVEAIKKLITEMNALHAFEAYQNVSVLAKKTLKGLNGRKKRKEYQGARGAAQKLFRENMLNPLTFFYQMGKEGNSIFQGLREGRDKETKNLAQAEREFKKLLEENQVTQAQIREWSGDKAKLYEINLVTDKIYMTKAEIMSLYELNKRRQAQGHMYDEEGNASRARGFRLPDRKIKTKTGTYLKRNVSHVSVSRKMVKEITALLTPQEKAVADGIARFFQTVTTDWGNEISMKLYGYKKYTAKDYFPISVDRNQIALTTDALGRAQTIKNMGFTKNTVKGANKPIDVEDIFDVFADRTAKMAIYNAYMPSLSDLQKWYNFNDPEVGNMKAALEQTFGRGSLDYIKNLMLDINGGGNAETGAVKYLTRAVKSAAVGANLRTAIQQPTAYIRAAMEIEPRYLIEGLRKEESWEEIKRYVPIAQWKDWGFFDVHTGRSMKSILIGSNSLQELLTEKSMFLASKMDELTWTRLWAAARAETRALHPELEPGTEAFYSRTAARMTEIIDKTQVVDSVLNRSQIMREKTLFKQMVTSFMAEPTQSYNMLYRAYYDMEQRPTKENRKKLAKAVFVFTQTGVATALAAALIDALRDEEDDAYWKRYMGAVSGNLADNLNPMNMVPYLRDVWSIMSGYDVKRMDMQAVEEAYNLAKEIGKAVSGESKLNVFGVMNKSLKLGSTVLGVPIYNLKRDIEAIVNQGLKLTGTGISLKTAGLDEGNEKNAGTFIADAVSKYMKGNKAAGDRIVRKLKAAGIENKKIDQAIKGSLKKTEEIIEAAEAKLAGDYKTYERIAKEVQEAGFTKEQVVSAVNSAIYKIKKEKEEKTEEEKEEEAEAGEETAYLYTGSDIVDAMESGDYRAANEMADRVFKEKTRMHEKESKIKSSIKSAIAQKYKDAYLNGTSKERQEIKRNLKRLRVNRKALYENEDFERWEEAEEKEERED